MLLFSSSAEESSEDFDFTAKTINICKDPVTNNLKPINNYGNIVLITAARFN